MAKPATSSLALAFNLAPEQAIAYFKSKGYQINPDGWAAVEARAHQKSFTVAGVAKLDLLQDIKQAIDKAQAGGVLLKQFQADLIPTLMAKGWFGTDPVTGRKMGTPYRLATIYRTNVQTAYMEGRWRGLMDNVGSRPWLQYVALMDSRVRPAHAKLNAKVFRFDDVFWTRFRPPIGFNCRCRIRALSDADLTQGKLTPETGDGRIDTQSVNVQGHPQPQAGYHDPHTKEVLNTDVGWGHVRDLLKADPTQFTSELAPLASTVNETAAAKAKAVLEAEAQAAIKLLAQDKGRVALARCMARLDQKIIGYQLEEAKAGNLGIWKKKAAEALDKSPGKYPGMTLDQLADQFKAAHAKSSGISKYKKAVIAGKKPSPSLKTLFDSLPADEQEQITAFCQAEVNKANPAPLPQKVIDKTLVPGSEPLVPDNVANWRRVSGQKGSNEGGFYEDESGVQWYVKFPKNPDQARNEVLAGKLYELVGAKVPELKLIHENGRVGLASRIINGLKTDQAALIAGGADGVAEFFAADAWLANWDVVGLGYDNLLFKAGAVYRVDTGGALLYRAQGGLKGAAFGQTITEFESLLNRSINPQAASVFGKLTEAEIKASAAKVLSIENDAIRALVREYGPGTAAEREALADLLVWRKLSIATRFPDIPGKLEALLKTAKIEAFETVLPILEELDGAIESARVALGANPHIDSYLLKLVAGAQAEYQSIIEGKYLSDNGLSALVNQYQPVMDAISEAVSGGLGSKINIKKPTFIPLSEALTDVDAAVWYISPSRRIISFVPDLFSAIAEAKSGQLNYLSAKEVENLLAELKQALGMGVGGYYGSPPGKNKRNAIFYDEMGEQYVKLLWTHTTSQTYLYVTEKLVDFYGNGVPLPPAVAAYERAINDALKFVAPAEMRHQGVSSRSMFGANREKAPAFIAKMKQHAASGKPYHFETISSTSRGDNGAFFGPVVLHVEGKTGVWIRSISQHPGEDEVLFGTETQFIVNDVKTIKNTTHIYLKEL